MIPLASIPIPVPPVLIFTSCYLLGENCERIFVLLPWEICLLGFFFFLVCAEGVYGHLQLRCVPLLTTWFLMQEQLEKLDGSRDLHVSAPDDNISKNELKNVP